MPDSVTPPSSNRPEPDLTGRSFGNYQILRRLGRGAMANVYLAEQTDLRRQVALKILNVALAADERFVKRFHREAQAAASLVHANIVQIYEVGCIEGFHFIAQEYVRGTNLGELLSRRGPISPSFAAALLIQVGAALQRSEQEKIVHRDIKPENIMISASGEIKVTDFGLAQMMNDGGVELTQVGVTLGTPLYMSPEQASGKTLDTRSDIYSLGVTCYHLMAGVPPFEGETALAVALQHANSDVDRLENHRTDVPANLCRVIHKMLAKSPDKRYQLASELLQDVRSLKLVDDALASETSVLATATLADSLVATATEPTRRLGKLMGQTPGVNGYTRRLIGTIAVALVGAFAVGGTIAWLTRSASSLSAIGSQSGLPKEETVEEQYWNATNLRSEEGWQAVIDNWPGEENEHYVHLAQQQLARYYLRKKGAADLNKAMKIFDQLSQRPKIEKELRAFGIAGQAIVHDQRHQNPEAEKKRQELQTDELRDRVPADMKRLLDNG